MPALLSVRQRKIAVWLAAAAAVCAGCGSSASTPLTGGGATQQAVGTPPVGAGQHRDSRGRHRQRRPRRPDRRPLCRRPRLGRQGREADGAAGDDRPASTGGCFGGNGRVGVLSFLDPRSGVGAPGVAGGPGFIGAEGGAPGQGQTGVSFGGPVSAPTPAFPSSLPAPSSFATPLKPAPLVTPTPTHSAAPPPPPPIFMPGPPARPPAASPTPSRRGIGPQPTPVPRPSPAP